MVRDWQRIQKKKPRCLGKSLGVFGWLFLLSEYSTKTLLDCSPFKIIKEIVAECLGISY